MVKRMSKISAFLFIILICVMPILGALDTVINDLNFLTTSEENNLQDEIEDITNTYGLQPVIVFVDDSSVYDSIAYADDYFDYNGYGVGENHEGILFLVDMYNRELVISTTGPNTISRYADAWPKMIDIISPYLTNQEYNQACQRFLELVVSVETTGKVTTYGYRLVQMIKSPIPYGLGLGVALIATIIITLSSKGKVTITNRTYETTDSFKLTNKVDQFEREHTTKHKIESNNSGGGSRTGSSGSSHGGGSGHF